MMNSTSTVHCSLFDTLCKYEKFDLMDTLFDPLVIGTKTTSKIDDFDYTSWTSGVIVATLRHFFPMQRTSRDLRLAIQRSNFVRKIKDNIKITPKMASENMSEILATKFNPPISSSNLNIFLLK